jgi:uncharacterized membrane protein YjgN (DUF898 family)
MNGMVVWLNAWGTRFCAHAGAMAIQSGVLILALLLLDGLLKSRVRATLRYGIWLLVIVIWCCRRGWRFPQGSGIGSTTPR